MLLQELFHQLLHAGATEVELKAKPESSGFGYDICYQLAWRYAGEKYYYQYKVPSSEFANILLNLEYVFSVLSHNASALINHAKSAAASKLPTSKESK